jgi:hypothetical protein
VALPAPDEATALLARLGLTDTDRAAMLAARPDPDGTPFRWWRLERTHRELVRRIGQLDGWFDGWFGWPVGPDPYLYPWVFVSVLPRVRDYHRRHGVPDAVSWATLADLGRHLARHRRVCGRPGLLNVRWLIPHFRGLLYQLGRLQYQRVGDLRAVWRPAPRAEPVLDVHIPATGPLNPALVEASLDAAVGFFARHFPTPRFRSAWCNSWLLDPQLARYLPESSNILAFQRRFELVPVPDDRPDDDLAVLEFVFERDRTPLRPHDLDRLPQRTSLERAVVTHLRAGGHWYFRPGRLPLGPGPAG